MCLTTEGEISLSDEGEHYRGFSVNENESVQEFPLLTPGFSILREMTSGAGRREFGEDVL